MNDDPEHDVDAFRQAMRDVRRLRNVADKAAPATPKPPARARFTRADQVAVLRESLLPPGDDTILAAGDDLNFHRPHIPATVLLKLRRGQFAVDAEIDLHGMTGAEAKVALRDFVTAAVQRRSSCVRIIHGKGRRSGPRGPVLKNVVNQWLQRIDHVQAFGSARHVDGGSGAVYVLLRVK